MKAVQSQETAIRFILQLMALSAIGGGLARTATGAARFIPSRGTPGGMPAETLRQRIRVPHGILEEEEDEIKQSEKRATEPPTPSPLSEDPLGYLSKLLSKLIGKPTYFTGKYSKGLMDNPIVPALGLPAAALSVYGGYKGVDTLLDWRRKREQKAKMDDAKRRYDQVVRDLYRMRKAGQMSGQGITPLPSETTTKRGPEKTVSRTPDNWDRVISEGLELDRLTPHPTVSRTPKEWAQFLQQLKQESATKVNEANKAYFARIKQLKEQLHPTPPADEGVDDVMKTEPAAPGLPFSPRVLAAMIGAGLLGGGGLAWWLARRRKKEEKAGCSSLSYNKSTDREQKKKKTSGIKHREEQVIGELYQMRKAGSSENPSSSETAEVVTGPGVRGELYPRRPMGGRFYAARSDFPCEFDGLLGALLDPRKSVAIDKLLYQYYKEKRQKEPDTDEQRETTPNHEQEQQEERADKVASTEELLDRLADLSLQPLSVKQAIEPPVSSSLRPQAYSKPRGLPAKKPWYKRLLADRTSASAPSAENPWYADWVPEWASYGGRVATGVIPGVQILASLLIGKMIYDKFSSRQKAKVLTKAIEQRRQKQLGGIRPMYVVEDEEDGELS